jgi:hypothetical protein
VGKRVGDITLAFKMLELPADPGLSAAFGILRQNEPMVVVTTVVRWCCIPWPRRRSAS